MNENKLQLKKESGWFYNKKYFLKSTRPSAVSIPPPPKDTSSFYFIHSLVFFFISFTFTLSLFIHSLPLYSLSLSLLSPSLFPLPLSSLSLCSSTPSISSQPFMDLLYTWDSCVLFPPYHITGASSFCSSTEKNILPLVCVNEINQLTNIL